MGHRGFGRNRLRGRILCPAPAASTTPARLLVMETRRWTNPSQPQTLQIGVFLLYATAVFGLIFGSVFSELGRVLSVGALGGLLGLAAVIGAGVAGFAIANDKRWGYNLGVALSILEVGLLLNLVLNRGAGGFVISLMFSIAQAVLLLHPLSRSYQKLWFN